MSIFDSFFRETKGSSKPALKWIDGYFRTNGGKVEAHWRTEANDTTADNLGTDVDGDGIPGFLDADENGDGLFEAIDLDGDGIADIFRSLEDISD